MFYVANVITFCVVSELLWKFNLLVRYKLNILQLPQINNFDTRELLFGGYARFLLLDKTVFYGYWRSLPFDSFLMLHTALTLFTLCNELCCSILNYPLGMIHIAFSSTCVSIITLVDKIILFS